MWDTSSQLVNNGMFELEFSFFAGLLDRLSTQKFYMTVCMCCNKCGTFLCWHHSYLRFKKNIKTSGFSSNKTNLKFSDDLRDFPIEKNLECKLVEVFLCCYAIETMACSELNFIFVCGSNWSRNQHFFSFIFWQFYKPSVYLNLFVSCPCNLVVMLWDEILNVSNL